jgi:hypothetical protein
LLAVLLGRVLRFLLRCPLKSPEFKANIEKGTRGESRCPDIWGLDGGVVASGYASVTRVIAFARYEPLRSVRTMCAWIPTAIEYGALTDRASSYMFRDLLREVRRGLNPPGRPDGTHRGGVSHS